MYSFFIYVHIHNFDVAELNDDDDGVLFFIDVVEICGEQPENASANFLSSACFVVVHSSRVIIIEVCGTDDGVT